MAQRRCCKPNNRKIALIHRPLKYKSRRPTAGFTLLELVVASTTAAVLMVGLSSSLYIAAQSLDVGTGSLVETRTANTALATINRDLQSALTLSELTATSVTMSVPDRDGDDVPETIRYYWTGLGSSPLKQTYNGTTTNLAANVQSFSLAWMTRLMDGVSTSPIVLFVSGQAPDGDGGLGTPTAAEQLRIDLMEGWGYDVTVISQQATQTEIDAELANANIVYVSGVCNGATIGAKLNAATLGVVTESFTNAEQLGFYSSLSVLSMSTTATGIVNTSHYITSGYSTGNLTVVSSPQAMKWTTSTTAPDAATIAEVDATLNFPSLLILDAGDELADSSAAAGRRCQLPWGEGGFDVTALNTDGQTLMQRAIEWAAGAGDDTETASGLVFEEFADVKDGSGSSSAALNIPSGTAVGDLLVAVMVVDGNDPITAPAGWNVVSTNVSSNRVSVGVWWKLAGSSEPSSHTFSWTDTEQFYGWIMRFTGHDPASPVNATAVDTGSASSPNSPAVTTSVDNCMVLRIGGFDDDDMTIGDTGLTGHTTINMDENKSGAGTVSGGAGYVMQATAGDAGTNSFALTASEEYVTVTIAIAPAP